MGRRVRVPKTDLVVLAEAKSSMKMLYEDADAVYFETADAGAEEKAASVGGLLDMDEGL
jgi:hypothetical protein